jgi:hypothetical protein
MRRLRVAHLSEAGANWSHSQPRRRVTIAVLTIGIGERPPDSQQRGSLLVSVASQLSRSRR